MTKAIVTQESAMTISNAVDRYNMMVEYVRTVMQDGKDYGTIPGTGNKPTLLKPGAEKLTSLFGYYPEYEPLTTVVDFDRPLFYLQYRATIRRVEDGKKVGEGIGSCNSMEVKYRYRQGERKCPACGKPTIIKGKEEYGGGWLCYGKKGGCGAKYREGDQTIEGQQVGRIENQEPFDLINTIDKMAQKRAFIAATLIACNASEFFTQDIEDMGIVEGNYTVIETTAQVTESIVEVAEPVKVVNDDKWDDLYQAVVDAGLSENKHSAKQSLGKCKTGWDTPEKAIAWMRIYRAWRDLGGDSKQASDHANKGEYPK